MRLWPLLSFKVQQASKEKQRTASENVPCYSLNWLLQESDEPTRSADGSTMIDGGQMFRPIVDHVANTSQTVHQAATLPRFPPKTPGLFTKMVIVALVGNN